MNTVQIPAIAGVIIPLMSVVAAVPLLELVALLVLAVMQSALVAGLVAPFANTQKLGGSSPPVSSNLISAHLLIAIEFGTSATLAL